MVKFLLVFGLLFSFSFQSHAAELPLYGTDCDMEGDFSHRGALKCSSGQMILVKTVDSSYCDLRYSTISFILNDNVGAVVRCVRR